MSSNLKVLIFVPAALILLQWTDATSRTISSAVPNINTILTPAAQNPFHEFHKQGQRQLVPFQRPTHTELFLVYAENVDITVTFVIWGQSGLW